ncbi:hypothetical protein SO802_034699 [Lithocarpus litseifolius]|uniref:Uncharacterized protein n=1 Tax=Lithocarpus litseifolius TaxID=425828 RepID=A0AAW2BK32_9ROSI
MQRQSLGSPVSKLHSHGGGSSKDADTPIAAIDSKRIEDDEEEHKATKLHRQSLSFTFSPPPKPEKFVHVIPILTLLCFLVLYLCSHSPSQSDLAQFNGFKRPAQHIDKIDDVGRFIELQKSDVLSIRSHRNLQELRRKLRSPKSRLHRKHADF